MKNFILILSLFVFLALTTESKAQPYYYNSGIPTLFENWGNIPGGAGAHPSSFGESTEYIIESGKTAVLDFQWFVDGNATLRINTGGTLQVNYSLNIGSNATLRIDSAGTFINNTTTLASNTVFGGKEDFDRHSNFIVKNWSGLNHPLLSGVLLQGISYGYYYFGNLEINWESCIGNWYINTNTGYAAAMTANDFRVTNTGKGKLVLPLAGSILSNYTIVTNYIQTGGEVDLSFGSSVTNHYGSILRIYGNFQKTGGSIDANGATSFGSIEFFKDTNYVPADTSFKTFYNSGILRRTAISCEESKLRLLSNLPLPSPDSLCFFLTTQSTIDCGIYKFTGAGGLLLHLSTIKMGDSGGFKNGASGGTFTTTGRKIFYPGLTFEFNGNVPQVTGDSLPATLSSHIVINNPAGVTLSKDLRITDSFYKVKFVNGKFNLANANLKISSPDGVDNANENSFINTNGTGCLRIGLDGGYAAKYPIGNGTFSPFYVSQSYSGNNDTIGVRVENSFGTHAPFDTSRCVRKLWRIFDENPSNFTSFRTGVQFMKSDAGSNMNFNAASTVGQYEAGGYNGYRPSNVAMTDNFYIPPDSTISKSFIGGLSYSTSGDDYYVFGNEEGVYETYFPDNSGDASQLGNWTSQNNLHPPSFDRYAIFLVPQGQTASFNNPITISDKALLRSAGNGVINANAPVTINGWLEVKDSSTYNYNNTGSIGQTCYAGREFFSEKSNFNILKWSDTTDKIFDGFESYYGNLTINFNNLPEPFGANKYWTVFKEPAPLYTTSIIRGNLTYIASSGYQFAPIGFGSRRMIFVVNGNLQIGDSLNQTTFPVMNLSGGTTRPADTTAGSLYLCGNLDIQNGGLTCQDFPAIARGNIAFRRAISNVPVTHTFYCYNPFLPQTSNLGNSAFPNVLEEDTLKLKSDMYRWGTGAFLFTDAWQVNSGAVMNLDTFRIRSLNLIVKNGGKLITKNREGLYADLANQTINFEPSSMLEFGGSVPQNFEKADAYNILNIPNVIINNPAGVTVNIPNINITNSITFTNGKVISTNANYLTFPDNIFFNGASDNSFLSGPVKISTSSTGIKTIPVGKGSVNRGLVIIPTTTSPTDWLVEYFNQQQAFGNTLGSGLTSISTAEYFLINRSGAANATVGLPWGSTSGVSNPANLRVARWNDFQWEDKGNSSYLGDPSAGVVFSNMITEFSPFVIASIDGQQLPVELSSFTAGVDKNNVALNWITETEQNNSGFEIERKSANDTVWRKITFINGAGNSNVRKIYKYEDRNLSMGNYSYRLKQIDYNGNRTYYNLSANISIGVPGKFALSQNYPNPFNPATKINFDLPQDSKVIMQIYDMTGRLVVSLIDNQTFSAGYHTVDVNAGSLASGTYFYRISAGNFVQTKKMQLIK